MLHDLEQSSQLTKWLYTLDALERCRARANLEARKAMATKEDSQKASTGDAAQPHQPLIPAQNFAANFASHNQTSSSSTNSPMEEDGPLESSSGMPLLMPHEETMIVTFYASKIPSLIGPLAQVPRLRRDIQVAATASMLFRRFFLSNSVMVFDPKAIMVAASFLASKSEEAMVDVRYLEEGTKKMDAPVPKEEIIPAELALAKGVDFDLLCFHPRQAVLALTEDLISFLKSERGQALASFREEDDAHNRIVKGPDLKPTHDEARKMMDDVIVSDIPLLCSPGQVGIAALMVANETLLKSSTPEQPVPRIDWWGYVQSRFQDKQDKFNALQHKVSVLCDMLKGLKEGQYGCGHHKLNMAELKAIHKKLKKCRTWGEQKPKKKKKKKKAAPTTTTTTTTTTDGDGDGQPAAKRIKTE